MALILTVIAVFLLLVVNEVWWQTHKVHGEFSRKFIHITVGSFVAFWPCFLSWHTIEALSISFFIIVLLSKQLHLFRAIHSVQRPTWGELLFALSVGGVALLTHDKYIYGAALLQMSLADGLAAIMGIRYGGRHMYSVLGYAKSIVGTLAFFVTSLLILLGYNHLAPGQSLSVVLVITISVLASILENIAVRGLDNLLVPMLVALLLAHH